MNDQTNSTPELSGEILIVDDDVINLQVLKTMLTRSGCQVTTSVDGTSALASDAHRNMRARRCQSRI